MQPTRAQVSAFTVTGLQVRTRNRDEMDPATARIGGLWDRFFSQCPAESAGADARMFGVYSGYESDEHGAFDVTASVPVGATDRSPLSGSVCVPILAGDYLVFTGQGTQPLVQLVIDTWGHVWRYFAENPQVRRRFGTDFEAYEGPDKVAIHIGVEV